MHSSNGTRGRPHEHKHQSLVSYSRRAQTLRSYPKAGFALGKSLSWDFEKGVAVSHSPELV